MTPRCGDGTLEQDSPLVHWTEHLFRATQEHGKPLAYNINTGPDLESQGFVDIREEVIQVPLNTWHPDPQKRELGRWFNLCLTESLDALSFGPLTRIAGWDKARVRALTAQARKDICARSVHSYFEM